MDLGKRCEEVCNRLQVVWESNRELVEMVVEESGKFDVGSDHNLIWSEVIWGRGEVRKRKRYKWRVDGKLDWEKYQETLEEVCIGWEEEMWELKQELGEGVGEAWSRWKKDIAAPEKGTGRKKVTERSEGWWSEDVERLIVIRKMTCRKEKQRSGWVRLH